MMTASRAILRRRFVTDYLHVSTRSIHWFQSLANGHGTCQLDSCGYSSITNHPSADNHIEDNSIVTAGKEKLLIFQGVRYLRKREHGIAISGLQAGSPEFKYPTGSRWMLEYIRNASTATAEKPGLGSDNESREELLSKKIKETSPEECDQAVEGLSTAKAKAKSQKNVESRETSKSVLQRVWATLLGIGPALRAVASMSREDWGKKLVHWKKEFVSTLQHYWLGLKLLWVNVRISSKLLLKLTGGKGLSRRERQQLTRTTADIFRLVPFAVFVISD